MCYPNLYQTILAKNLSQGVQIKSYIPIYEQKILNSKVKCVYLDSLAIKNVMFR